MIRQPIIVVMGHVDHGKTTLLDRIRNTSIAAKEAGGITQHIGASEVPLEAIKKICGVIPNANTNLRIPGLLFIDTPGHEAFTNLRRRGSSVADMAILVVDIMKGFEPQTIEAIKILKSYKTPFIVAANKIDVITGWRESKSASVAEALKEQDAHVAETLNAKVYELVGRLSEQGFSSDLYSNIKNFQNEVAVVPISAKTGTGIPELLMLVAGLAQRYLELKLTIEVDGPGKGSILEKKEERGMGMTIDVILYDGTLHVNDTIAFACIDGTVKTTKIKALLKPKPLHEMRESASGFSYVESVSAAAGVKISALGLEDAIPGSSVIQTTSRNYLEEINSELGDVFKTDKLGLILKSDSIGGIEGLSKLLESEGIMVSKKGIGSVTKRDVIDAFSMNGKDPLYSVVLAFNVGIDQDAEEAALSSGVKIMRGSIIYKLVDDYKEFAEQKRANRAKQVEERLSMPAMLQVVPGACFRISHPAIFGVDIMEGSIRPGNVIMNEAGETVGRLKGIQNEKSPMAVAKKGDRVAVSMDEPTFGRQVRENQVLYTRVSDDDARMLKGEFSPLLGDVDRELLQKILDIKANAKQSKKQGAS
jgi:translation initiation factor 5B